MSLSVKNQKNSSLKSIKSNNKLDLIKTASLPMLLPDLHKGMNTRHWTQPDPSTQVEIPLMIFFYSGDPRGRNPGFLIISYLYRSR